MFVTADSLRSKKLEKDRPPLDLSALVIPRGRNSKRTSSSRTAPQVDCAANSSTSVAEPLCEQRPRKRHKRSSSTPAAPRPSQLSAQLLSRRRTRSRAGSPATDLEYVPPTRTSSRLSRRIRSLFDIRGSDIYTHLADPDGAGGLLNDPPVASSSVVLSTPNETVGIQSVKKTRRRRRKVDLTDENTKRDLMEEWARMRQSQGTLPLSGMNGNMCFSQAQPDVSRKGTGSVSSVQLETVSRPDPQTATCQSVASVSRSRETMLDVSLLVASSTRTDSTDVLHVGTNAPGHKVPDHSEGGAGLPVVPCLDTETLSTSIFDSQLDNDSPGSPSPPLTASPSQEIAVLVKHTEATELPKNVQRDAARPDPQEDPTTLFQTYLNDDNGVHLDSDEEFHMLDVPEIFTLPWVPVTSHLYVPPSLGKLISGMREQLAMEARARRRAEEHYLTELSKRIAAEKRVEDLKRELERRLKDLSEDQFTERS